MRFFSSLTLLSLATLGLATPTSEAITRRQEKAGAESHGILGGLSRRSDRKTDIGKYKRNSGLCLCQDDIDTLVDAYRRMLSRWDDTDAKYLADTFVDTSDSINILAGIPLGSPTFPSKEAFIDHQHVQVTSSPSSQLPTR
jgi:hypothetical protein